MKPRVAGSNPAGRELFSIPFLIPYQYGGRSSVGRAPDCDSGGRGFKPHRSPHLYLTPQHVVAWSPKASAFDKASNLSSDLILF